MVLESYFFNWKLSFSFHRMEKMGHPLPTPPCVDSKKCCCIIEVYCALSGNFQRAGYEPLGLCMSCWAVGLLSRNRGEAQQIPQ